MAFMSSQMYLILWKLYKRTELNYPLENIVHYKIFSHLPLMWQSHFQLCIHTCSDGLKNRNGGIDGVCICRSAQLHWPLHMGNEKKSHRATNEYGGCARMSQPGHDEVSLCLAGGGDHIAAAAVLNIGHVTHYYTTLDHNMHHWLKGQGGTAWCNTSPSRVSAWNASLSEHLDSSLQLSLWRQWRMPFCTWTFQFWIIRVHPLVIHCQNGRKEYFTFPPPLVEMCSGSAAHVWHAGLHSVCVESTL